MSLENVTSLIRVGLESIGIGALDVLSLDLDGNDYYLAREILKADILPKLFILEYNAKFPPPIRWKIEYDANHSWDSTDYQGASLGLFAELLSEFSYTLICCNAATGANAFFVKNEYLSHFAEAPKSIDDIFIECRYQVYKRWGHPPPTENRSENADGIDGPLTHRSCPSRHFIHANCARERFSPAVRDYLCPAMAGFNVRLPA